MKHDNKHYCKIFSGFKQELPQQVKITSFKTENADKTKYRAEKKTSASEIRKIKET